MLDEKTVTTIWHGLGQYIAKQMRNGKGVFIPKFGNFTFSAPLVDLAVIYLKTDQIQGTTNPQERDAQHRIPVFLVGKDFVSAVTLKTGLAHNGGSSLRPYDIKGSSGIIPKVKINYTEVASYCGQSKDICRNGCEQVFRFLSDKARKGENVSMDIPFVGTFIVRSGIAAVSYLDNLTQETKGSTAKTHLVNKLFANSINRLNMQIFDEQKAKQNPSQGLGGAMRLTGEAEYGSARPDDLKRKSWALNYAQNNKDTLTEQTKAMFDRMSETKSGPQTKRPMSAVTRSSRMTNVPEVNRMKLMLIATEIHKNRQLIIEVIQQLKQSIRNIISSTELQQILKKAGIFVEIGNLKALLRELGYSWNGPSCSVYELFQSCKTFLFGQSEEEARTNKYFESLSSPKQQEVAKNDQSYDFSRNFQDNLAKTYDQMIQNIRDLFYSSGKTIQMLYSSAKLGNNVDFEGLKKIINQCSKVQLKEEDILSVFKYVARGKQTISYQDFEKTFKWEMPAGGDWETIALRKIREWMIKKGLSSETAFDQFLKVTGKFLKKRLTRVDLHKAFNSESILDSFSAPEIDTLFTILDANQDGELDVEEWKQKIYEDSCNPIQMLREIVSGYKLTPDDLIFKMHLRYWDPPLEFPQFSEALRRLDPSLSETQLRHLAKSLKSKDNRVEITTLLRNLCGSEHETVDYRNKIFRQIYAEVNPHKIDELMKLLEDTDPLNDGRVEPQGLKLCLRKVVKSLDEDSIDRFVRFLDKDKSGKINYMDFMQRMSEVSNRDHNPFKSVVQRVSYFITSNNQSVQSLLKRLLQNKQGSPSDGQVSVEQFAQFLKNKIDKKRDYNQLRNFAFQIDIDKDGIISENDLQTCLNNLNSETFFKNSGEALASSAFASAKKFFPHKSDLSEERANELMKQIRTALINKRIAYKEAFNKFDTNKDGFLNFAEFSQGIDTVLTLSVPIKEKIFALMDKNQIGLVDYNNFLLIIQMSSANKMKSNNYQDNFDWENSVIDKIIEWIFTSKITVEEAFKSFDKDFDGKISKDDLKWALVNVIQVPQEEIYPTKLDRLFKLMDFYKTNQIQLTDFQRLINNENPYSTTSSRATPSTENFRKSFGGGFMNSGAFDWKVSVIQQIGLILSKSYQSLKESFEEASEHLQKVTYEQFKVFIEKLNALRGFNLTGDLLQKVFSEIDPHKKGYISEQDWNNAFQSFNWNEQMFIELKNTLSCSFANCDSAFDFILTFKQRQQEGNKTINYSDFEKAISSLTTDRFKKHEMQSLWKFLTDNGKVQVLDKYQFRTHFDSLKYTGNSSVKTLKSATPGARTTIYTQSSSSSTWNEDIFEKLRQIIKASSQSFEDIFRNFDTDKNGSISQVEFRNALRKLNLGLTSREIDKLMQKIDTNSDGKIDWKEFVSKFKTSELDERLKERAKDKMARLKELMILHMISPNDAFRLFDQSKMGKLTYQEFSKLVIKLNEVSGEKPHSYPVIKDLFDTIDVRKDGIIDMNEWQQTFGHVIEGSNKLSIKATPLTMWENSKEFQDIGSAIARNRKTIKDNHAKVTKGTLQHVSIDQMKLVLDDLLQYQLKGLNDDKIKCVIRVAEVPGSAQASQALYDVNKLLDVYKARHAGPQL